MSRCFLIFSQAGVPFARCAYVPPPIALGEVSIMGKDTKKLETGFGRSFGEKRVTIFMRNKVVRIFMIFFVALMLGCSESPPPLGAEPSVGTVAARFKEYRRMTEEMVFVNPEFLVQCVSLSNEQVETARAKFGPHANTGIVIYMNELAAAGFLGKSNSFPAGAVIVKEKQMGGGAVGNGLGGVGGMI